MTTSYIRILFIALLFVMGAFFSAAPVLSEPISDQPILVRGDLNGDGNVDIADAVMVMQILAGMIPESEVFISSDVNRDGRIGLADALYVLQVVSGLRATAHEYSDADFAGPWIVKVAGEGMIYAISDGTGGISEYSGIIRSGHGVTPSGGAYAVEADGSLSLVLDIEDGATIPIEGVLESDTGGIVTSPGDGTVRKVVDKGLCEGTWTGTLTENGADRQITFTVDSGGDITSFTGLQGPVSGRMFSASGDLAACIKTGESRYYNQVALEGTLSGDGISGDFHYDGPGGPNGTFSLTRATTGESFTNSLGMTFNLIPAGTFMMGSPEDEPERRDRETQHQVTLTKSFYMQTTEVTQGQWKAVMGSNPSYFSNCGDDCPVEMVSWNDVQEFITELHKLGESTYRLPTEAEWEYAARAGTTTQFNTGHCLSTDQANYDGNYPYTGCPSGEYRGKPLPVASFAPNAWGLYDMHGNVWEWVQGWYGSYPTSAVTDPTGPTLGSARVLRGGCWYSFAGYCRSAARFDSYPGYRNFNGGFRLVLPQVP